MKNDKLPRTPTASATAAEVPNGAQELRPSHGLDQRIVDSLIAGDDEQIRELARGGLSEASMRARARALGITWEFIKQCRLSGSRPAMRTCMCCDATFLSAGIENRLCRRCVRR